MMGKVGKNLESTPITLELTLVGRSANAFSGVVRNRPDFPKVTQSRPKSSEVIRNHPKSPGVTRSLPESSRVTRNHPDSPGCVRSRSHLESSGVVVVVRSRPESAKGLCMKCTRKQKEIKTLRNLMPDHKHIASDGSC